MITASTPWWREDGGFFGDVYKEADDSVQTFFGGEAGVDDRTGREVEGVIRLCGLRPGDHVLDCPCGYGRHSVGLARRGMRVTGVDINSRFLTLARKSAADHKVTPSFLRADMRDLPAVGPLDAVINMFYSFGFFTPEEDLRVLRTFHDALKEGGPFLMHTMVTLGRYEAGLIPAEERRPLRTGGTLVARRRLNPRTLREEGEWSIVGSDGRIRSMTPYDVRIDGPEEFAGLGARAGFRSVELFGDWDAKPYANTDPYLIVVARR
jgi:SAM-dependent methyltransferase